MYKLIIENRRVSKIKRITCSNSLDPNIETRNPSEVKCCMLTAEHDERYLTSCRVQDKSKDSKAHPLSVQNIGGVFVVLLCGLALAIMVAILEFCWNSRKNAMNDRSGFFWYNKMLSYLLFQTKSVLRNG